MALNSSVQLPPPSEKRLIKTALHQAVLDCRLHQVRLLVDKHGANVDTKDLHGRTPLMLACLLENEEQGFRMARIFLRAGSCLNLKDGLGRTALSYAAMNGREDIVQAILKEDVLDINEPDNDGNTPLHHACSSGNPSIVEQLVETFAKFGLNVDRRNKLGYTPLLLACKLGHYVSAHLLITVAKASPTLRDSEFYLNAAEWTQRSHQIQVTVANTARGTSASVSASTPHSLSFSRESSMYRRPWTPQCCHVKSQRQNAISYSIGSILRLPALLYPPPASARSGFQRSEVFIDGKDAREVLRDIISDCEARQRPTSTHTTHSRWSHPPTAKLLALTRRSRTSVAQDIVSLFRLYSDQYQPAHWRTRIPADDRHRRHVVIASSADTSSEAESPIEVFS